MKTQINRYFSVVRESLDTVLERQLEALEEAAAIMADTVEKGNALFITGCSHSSIFAQEVFYRAGGFLLMNPIFLPGMSLDERPVTRTSRFERIPGIAAAVLEESPIRAGDLLVIASISGRNAVPVEMAIWAKHHQVTVAALTSVTYSSAVASRHESGKRLFELADLVLDLMCPPGDAVLDIPGLPEKIGPVSTIIGVTMMHAVIAQAIERLAINGITPPVFLSGNTDKGDRYNRELLKRNRDRIHYL